MGGRSYSGRMSFASTAPPSPASRPNTTRTATTNTARRAGSPVASPMSRTNTAPPRYAPIIVSAPWAKLSTPIRPKTRVRPAAIITYSADFERPSMNTSARFAGSRNWSRASVIEASTRLMR